MVDTGTGSNGNHDQIRLVAEAMAESMAVKFSEQPEPVIPAPLKWASGIIGAVITAGVIALAVWLVTSVSQMQVTLARVDERLKGTTEAADNRDNEQDRRITRLESLHGE